MTRREEIEIKALSEYRIKEKENKKATGTYDANLPRRKAFIEDAEWMQKQMIDKACEYLKKTMHATPVFEHDDDKQPVYYVCASCCDSVEEFINNFRKAMEE